MKPEERTDIARFPLVILGTLGIVYGDIGTSPLYALRECFLGHNSVPVTAANVYGVLSLVFWSLIIIVSVKYLLLVMRADNHEEGGILALMTLVVRRTEGNRGLEPWLEIMGLFGAALLYGDGMITPAISVLSSVEGLNVATSSFEPFVIPIALTILITLFFFQHKGTGWMGDLFGPVMLLWFFVIGALGLHSSIKSPEIVESLNPVYAIEFFIHNGWRGFFVIGTIFLVVTGGEALYADMGHFGKKPIRLGWFFVVLPCLLLNYLGQGASLMRDPGAVENLFYRLAPSWALYPMVALATAATVIASQAVISGSFSLARQAMQLGYSPRLSIIHTSSKRIGQVYVPVINWFLFCGTILLVLGFRHSGNLAAAYGVAVSATMVITTILILFVAHRFWAWGPALILCVAFTFLPVDLAFLGSNLIKIVHGGWVPIVVASALFFIMSTWNKGRSILREKLHASRLPIKEFIQETMEQHPIRIPGTAFFLSGSPVGTPGALVNNFRHNKILHQNVIILHVATKEVPYVPPKERLHTTALGDGFYRMVLYYGFSEYPDPLSDLSGLSEAGLHVDFKRATFFLGRKDLVVTKGTHISIWQKRLFLFLSRNAAAADRFFRLPHEQVIELGVQLEL